MFLGSVEISPSFLFCRLSVSAVRSLTGSEENIFKVGSLHNITMHGKDSWTVVLLGATRHCVCVLIV